MENAQNNAVKTYEYSQREYQEYTSDEHEQKDSKHFIKCIEIEYTGINTYYDEDDGEDVNGDLKASLIKILPLCRWVDRHGNLVEQRLRVWLPSKGVESVSVEVDVKNKTSKATLKLNGFGKKVLLSKLSQSEIAHLKKNNGELHRTKKPW